MPEKKYTYGKDNQDRAYRVLQVLLDYSDSGIEQGKIECLKTDRRLTFEISKTDLIRLVRAIDAPADWEDDIRPVISHYLTWLGILKDNRTVTKGSSIWKFSLDLWCDNTSQNLERFREEWNKKAPKQDRKNTSADSTDSSPNTSNGSNWLHLSQQLLTQQKNLTTNPLQLGATRNLDDVHVPLGLMERKERPRVKQEPSPEAGSQLYQELELTETKRFEHEEFLAEVVGKRRTNSKHIAIIGEPGAGKTTLLTKIGEWLLNSASQSESLIVVWVSLAAVGSRRLEDYLKEEWLRQVWDGEDLTTPWESFKQLREQGQVWLLLDGLDEMSGDAVRSIQRDLSEAWARNLRVVVTCRLNQWDGDSNILTNSFEVYRTLDYEYRTATGEDRVLEFLTKWFGNPDTAKQIRISLDDPGKERIKDLVKNPLRLTLFCASWAENQALPETQAELYRRFVNYLYQWKAQEFQAEVSLRQHLDPALGKLAIAGLNRQPNSSGAVRRFRFTEQEIAKLWQDLPDTLLPAAKKLGWLNSVGMEAGENIYAFFHPTFQEYFAACSIEDWDYFLPRAHVDRPVPCMGEKEPTYRVFEKEWQQPILLWIGRGDVDDELKEEFIEKLTNFEEQEEEFYFYRAYCLAAICVSEFKSAQSAQEIVEGLIVWDFGYFDNEIERWITFFAPIKSLARETIFLTHTGYAITPLVRLLAREDLDNKLRFDAAEVLAWIGQRNERAIIALAQLLSQEDLNYYCRSKMAELLGRLGGMGNERAITALLQLLQQDDVDDDLFDPFFIVAYGLCWIDVGNERAIVALVQLLQRDDLEDYRRSSLVNVLGQIGMGNEQAIAALIQLLQRDDVDDDLLYRVAYALGRIDVGNERATAALVQLLQRDDLDDRLFYNVAYGLGQIDVGNERAIAALIQLLQRDNVDDDLFVEVPRALGQIGMGNEQAIVALVQLLQRDDLEGRLYDRLYDIVENVLSEIDVENERAISTLIKLLAQEDRNDYYRSFLEDILGWIGRGNERAISTLIELLTQEDLEDYRRSRLVNVLGQIGMGNEQAIAALIRLLQRDDLDDDLLFSVAYALGQTGMGNETAIAALVQLLQRDNIDDDLLFRVAYALGRIDVGNERAIATLVRLVQRDNIDDDLCFNVAYALGQIDVGNERAITALIRLLQRDNIDDYDDLFFRVAQALNRIGIGNEQAIAALIRLLQRDDLGNYRRRRLVNILSQIGMGNEQAIAALAQLLQRDDVGYDLVCTVIDVLGQIGMGNEQAISTLVQLLALEDVDDRFRSNVAFALGRIVTNPMMPSVVSKLKNHITNQVYKSNFDKYEYCYQLIFPCALTLPYPTFHAAWHQTHLPVTPLTPSTIPSQLNRPHTILLNITTFNYHTPAEISQTFTNLIYSQLQIQPIPTVTNSPQLQTHLLNLNYQPHLVIIVLHPKAPTPTLIQEISKLPTPKQIQIIWLTNASIPDAFPPEQPDLEAAIQSAIDRFTE